MAYIFGLKQATKMGLSLLHSPFKVCVQIINLKVGVLLDHGVSLCFVLLPAHRTL